MTSNKFVPEAFRPISDKLLSLLSQLSDFDSTNQGLNSKVKRTYLNPSTEENN